MKFLAAWGALLQAQVVAPHPPSVDACVTAAERAQELRRQDRLLAASNELAVCVLAACPSIVRSDCEKWSREVRARIPRIIVSVRDDQGLPASADLTLDGVPWRAPAKDPVALDPGLHTLEARSGDRVARTTFTLSPSATVREVVLTFASMPRPTETSPWAKPRVYVPAAVTVLSSAAFGVFEVMGQSRYDELRDGCGRTGSCARADVDALQATFDRAAVALVVAGVALGVTVWQVIATRNASASERAEKTGSVF